jgi:hypothetical protein
MTAIASVCRCAPIAADAPIVVKSGADGNRKFFTPAQEEHSLREFP